MEPARTVRAKPTRIIGIDYGVARFGIAVSDETKIIAMPLMTITAESKSEKTADKILNELKKISDLNRYDIAEIVIGLPLMMSGKFGMQADDVTHFVELLRTKTTIPVVTWDERLTTVQAEKSMREGNMSRKKRSKVVDKVAAVIILQSYLDRRSFGIF
jgi:putative Holliday junction resolvase